MVYTLKTRMLNPMAICDMHKGMLSVLSVLYMCLHDFGLDTDLGLQALSFDCWCLGLIL